MLTGVCGREQIPEWQPFRLKFLGFLFGFPSDYWSEMGKHLAEDLERQLVDWNESIGGESESGCHLE